MIKINWAWKLKKYLKSFNYINKNLKLLQPHYKNDIFSEIQFHYKEITYIDFIRSSQDNNKLLLQKFIKTVETKNH